MHRRRTGGPADDPDASVTLRDFRDADGIRHLSARLDAGGNLVIEGQDLGDGVERAFGVREYEWTWTIAARDLPALRAALAVDGDLLQTLAQRFGGSAAAGLGAFLDAHAIQRTGWSRLGD
jgi:hypothetical protein